MGERCGGETVTGARAAPRLSPASESAGENATRCSRRDSGDNGRPRWSARASMGHRREHDDSEAAAAWGESGFNATA